MPEGRISVVCIFICICIFVCICGKGAQLHTYVNSNIDLRVICELLQSKAQIEMICIPNAKYQKISFNAVQISRRDQSVTFVLILIYEGMYSDMSEYICMKSRENATNKYLYQKYSKINHTLEETPNTSSQVSKLR